MSFVGSTVAFALLIRKANNRGNYFYAAYVEYSVKVRVFYHHNEVTTGMKLQLKPWQASRFGLRVLVALFRLQKSRLYINILCTLDILWTRKFLYLSTISDPCTLYCTVYVHTSYSLYTVSHSGRHLCKCIRLLGVLCMMLFWYEWVVRLARFIDWDASLCLIAWSLLSTTLASTHINATLYNYSTTMKHFSFKIPLVIWRGCSELVLALQPIIITHEYLPIA